MFKATNSKAEKQSQPEMLVEQGRLKLNDRHKGLIQCDGHFLIQLASYLQCGRAAYPAYERIAVSA